MRCQPHDAPTSSKRQSGDPLASRDDIRPDAIGQAGGLPGRLEAGCHAMHINPKQEAFCLAYARCKNATEAAIEAGYSADTATEQGSRLLSKVNVKARVDELFAEQAVSVKVDAAWVMERLKIVADRCMQAEPVLDRQGKQVMCETAEGDLVPAFTFDSRGANRAIELLGKHRAVNAFEDQVRVTGSLDLADRITRARSRNGDESEDEG